MKRITDGELDQVKSMYNLSPEIGVIGLVRLIADAQLQADKEAVEKCRGKINTELRLLVAKLYDIWVQNPDTTEMMLAKEEAVRNQKADQIIKILEEE